MAKFEDLKGQKFGYWTVVERAANHPTTRSTILNRLKRGMSFEAAIEKGEYKCQNS